VFKYGFVVLIVVAAFFVYHSILLQSQLTQAKNDGVQLQSQLDQTRGEIGKAQATARDASDQATKLQTQLDQDKGDVADAKANADKASGEVAQLRAQLERANSEAAAAKTVAQKASGEIAKLKAQLLAPQPKPTAAEPAPVTVKPSLATSKEMPVSAKEMPVSVSFRKALVGDGNAVVLQNTSTNSLPVNVRFTDPTATRTKEFRLALDAGATKELGSLGAWILTTGDKIEIESVNYDTIVKTAP